jgi:HlyD family secretion protein
MAACNRNDEQYDASGTFEADEVIVPRATGKLILFNVHEGDNIKG